MRDLRSIAELTEIVLAPTPNARIGRDRAAMVICCSHADRVADARDGSWWKPRAHSSQKATRRPAPTRQCPTRRYGTGMTTSDVQGLDSIQIRNRGRASARRASGKPLSHGAKALN